MEEVRLRDGSVTQDRRLDRIKQFDPRNKLFSVEEVIPTKEPRTQSWPCKVWLDQGSEGACVGFGVAHEIAASPLADLGVSNQYARERIYWEAQKIDPWPGGAYPGADPFMEGTSVLAGLKVAQSLGHFDEYRWADDLQGLILGVGYKSPAIIGVDWFEGMYRPDSDGVIHPTGEIVGGHCILVTAVNVTKRRFRLHNSWGTDYGRGGDAFISFDDMEFLIGRGADIAFTRRRHRVLS